MRHMLSARAILVALGAVVLIVRGARAQEVGTIAAFEGTVEIGRGGAWRPVAIGTPVNLHDELRSGRPGRVRLVFRDDSVLNLGDDSQLVIDEQVFDPNQGQFRSLMHLLKGKVRALVSDYYRQPRAEYQIESVTAVSGVRGTEFIVSYDPIDDATDVVGIEGQIEVHSPLDRLGRGVLVTAHELTRVERGQFPTPPRHIDEELFRQYVEGLAFSGGGSSESLTIDNPLIAGTSVSQTESPQAFPSAVAAGVPRLTPFESRASNAIDQPPDILRAIQQNNGDLGVHF